MALPHISFSASSLFTSLVTTIINGISLAQDATRRFFSSMGNFARVIVIPLFATIYGSIHYVMQSNLVARAIAFVGNAPSQLIARYDSLHELSGQVSETGYQTFVQFIRWLVYCFNLDMYISNFFAIVVPLWISTEIFVMARDWAVEAVEISS